MNYETRIKIAWTVYVWSNGWVVIGIVLMIWANNIERPNANKE